MGSSVLDLWCHQSHHGWGQASKAHMTNLERLNVNMTPWLMQNRKLFGTMPTQCGGCENRVVRKEEIHTKRSYKLITNEGVKLPEAVLNI